MNENDIYDRIQQALEQAPRNQYTSELHLQMIKYADDLKNITAKAFCEGMGLNQSLGTAQVLKKTPLFHEEWNN